MAAALRAHHAAAADSDWRAVLGHESDLSTHQLGEKQAARLALYSNDLLWSGLDKLGSAEKGLAVDLDGADRANGHGLVGHDSPVPDAPAR